MVVWINSYCLVDMYVDIEEYKDVICINDKSSEIFECVNVFYVYWRETAVLRMRLVRRLSRWE